MRDGRITQHLLHPRRAHPRTYRATVKAVPADLANRLVEEVSTAAGVFRAD